VFGRTYAPGSTLVFEGEKQRELIVVRMGQLELYASDTSMAICSLREGDFIGDYQLLFSVQHKYTARANVFVETVVLTVAGLMDVLNADDFREISNICKDGHFRGSTDSGVQATKDSYEERMTKYNKLHENMTKKNNKMADMMAGIEDRGKKGIIMPYSPFHVYWDVLLLLATTYQCIAIVMRINHETFNYLKFDALPPFSFSLYVDYFFDLIFIADMFLNAQVFAYNDISTGRAEIVSERSLILANYVASSRFKLDVVAALPVDIVGFALDHKWSYLRLIKLLRFFSITGIIKEFSTHMTDVYDKIVSNGVRTSLTMFIWTIIMAVWTCVAWNILHFQNHADYNLGGSLEGYDTFIPSLYWTFTTFTTVGYGDIYPETVNETLFASVIGAIGAVSAAAVIANVSSFLHSTSVSEDNIDHRRKTVSKFLSDQTISAELQYKLETYYKFIDEDRLGIEESSFLKANLPTNLRDDMMLHITSDMVLACDFLAGCESGFIRCVMLSVEQRFYAKGQLVLDDVTPANGMYFIKSGIVELFSPDGKLSNRLTLNGSFAEDALLNHWEKNPYTAKCVGDCELWFFGRALFNKLINEWPNVRDKLGKLVAKASSAKRRSSVSMSPAELAPILLAVEAKRAGAKVLHPEGRMYLAWKTVLLLAIMYNTMVCPFRFAFAFDHGHYYDNKRDTDVDVDLTNDKINIAGVVADYLCDIIYLVDILIHARFLGFTKNDIYYYHSKDIFMHFLRSEPWVRMIFAVLPFEVLLVAISPSDFKMSVMQMFALFRFNRVLRALETMGISDYIQKGLRKRNVKMHKNGVRLTKILIATFCCAHYMASIFFFIGLKKHVHREGNSWVDTACIMTNVNHVDADCDSTEPVTVATQYITALYWSVATLTTVGYGDISANQGNVSEVYYNIVTLIMGTLIYTLIIANLEDMVSQLDTTMSLYKEKLDSVKQYSNQQNLDDELSGKILTYFEHLWQHQSGVDGNSLLSYMPTVLSQQVVKELIGHHLKKMFYVKNCHRDFVERLTLEMSSEKYMPDDVVFHSGELATTLFILYRGKVKLLSKSTGVEYTTLQDCMIGEGEFFTRALQPCDAIATIHADVFTLTFDRFWRVLSEERLVNDFKVKLVEKAEELNKNCVAFMIEKLKANMKNAKMAKMMNVEMEEEGLKYWVSDPGSVFRKVWDLVGLAFTVYIGVHVPYQVAFATMVVATNIIVDVVACLFFLVDVYFKCMHFSTIHEGQLVQNRTIFRGLYMRSKMPLDLLSACPIFFVALAIGGVGKEDTGYLWLFGLNTFLRVKRGNRYFSNLIDLVELLTGYRSSSSTIRMTELFLMVCAIAHWMGCAYFYMGRKIDERGESSWLSLMSMNNEQFKDADLSEAGKAALEQDQYVTSFYWALYTISTTGYGNVKPSQNVEKVYCMVCMVVGAIVCDAGITAVLTSLIENRDHQAGTNSRRMECCKKYMTQALSGNTKSQDQVLDFFNYEDSELKNIDSELVLQKIGIGLKLSIISRDCETILSESEIIGKHSKGLIMTILRHMQASVVIPEERILDMDKDDECIYVLKSGRARGEDDAGGKHTIQSGAIISNLEWEERRKQFGLPTHGMRIIVHRAWNLPKTDMFGACDPYVEIKYGKHGRIRSSVKKVTRSPSWKEIFYVKMTKDVKDIEVTLYDWNRVEDDEVVGGFNVPVNEMKTEGEAVFELVDESGATGCGNVALTLHHGKLQEHQTMTTPRLTVSAESYCQVYKVDVKLLKQVEKYVLMLEEPEVGDRLPYYDENETPVEKFHRETMAKGKLEILASSSLKDLMVEGEEEEESGGEGGRRTARSGSASDTFDIEGGTKGDRPIEGRERGERDSMFKPRKGSILNIPDIQQIQGRTRGGSKKMSMTSAVVNQEELASLSASRRGSFKFGFARQNTDSKVGKTKSDK